ncbi:MAG: hypothetical protein V1802_00670 [Candidatus Aenigmatarchaeota archaeon]
MPFGIPLSVGYYIGLLVDALIVFVVLIIADKLVAHNFEIKRTLILAIVALFLTPIITSFIGTAITLPSFVFIYILPLIVWIVLGEILLKEAGIMAKLKVIVIAFVVWTILNYAGIPGMLMAMLP